MSSPASSDLPSGPHARGSELINRLRVEQRQSWLRGDGVRVETLLERHPWLRDSREAVLDLIYSEYVLREELGETPDPEEYRAQFPALGDELQRQFEVHQMLAKGSMLGSALQAQSNPQELSTRDNSLLDAPEELTRDSGEGPPPTPQPERPRPGTGVRRARPTMRVPSLDDYQIVQELGHGGMGVVYKAFNRKRNQTVALKTFQRMDAEALLRFKQEFRALAGVTHPNLVSLHELVSDGQHWFIAMEFVQGVDFLSFVRGCPVPTDALSTSELPLSSAVADVETVARPMAATRPDVLGSEQLDRLRNALRQLADGVVALHDAGKLHRDLKPSNVMVTREGRVVMLDFGLVAELDRGGVHQSTEQHVLGTVPYMSPEQAASQPVTAASDWYSVGVMLYEALAHRWPFVGTVTEVLRQKAEHDPRPPSDLAGEVPADLEQLCIELLKRDPRARPTGREVLRRLRGDAAAPPPAVVPPQTAAGTPTLVGREPHLQALARAYADMKRGRTIVTHVRGASGAGKSSLVLCFLEALGGQSEAVVLAGQCYEQESVPYKAFDQVVDALSRYLRRLAPLATQAFMPRDMPSLVRVFPVLRRVELGTLAERQVEVVDSRELRRRAFGALRELLARLGDRKPLVLAIDDLQWGDPDSAALLADLLRPPDPPVLLLVASYRSEEVDSSAFLRTWLAKREPDAIERREVAVDPLTADEARELALRLLGGRDAQSQEQARAVAEESGGNPFFIYELAQFLQAGGGLAARGRQVHLGDVLWARMQRLPAEAQRLLELVAVAGRPFPLAVATSAARLGDAEMSALATLRSNRLIRGTGLGEDDLIAAYHDRVRETVSARLAPERRQSHHLDLARSMEAAGEADPEFLAVHFQGAQEPAKAGEYYARAAAQAAQTLAFDRAARLYRLALELTPSAGQEAQGLRTALGDALANAGRGSEAAQAYLEAAELNSGDTVELRRRAATQLLRSGHVDRGLTVLGTVLQAVGMEWPKTPGRAFRLLLWRRFRLWWRGLSFRERPATEISPETLLRLDICWYVGACLTFIDWVRGAELQGRGLLLALQAGEPERIARALAMETGHAGVSGGASAARAARVLQAAEALAKRVNLPYVWGVVECARGGEATNVGRWKRVWECCVRGEEIFRNCTGAAWELDTARAYSLSALAHMGEIAELSRRCRTVLHEARERDDRYLIGLLGTYSMTLVWLAEDNADEAQRGLDQIRQQWTRDGFHIQHHAAFLGQVLIALYRQDGAAALEIVFEHVPAYRRSLLWHIQHFRIDVLQYHARSALAAAATVKDPGKYLAIARDRARDLEREKMPWATALARLIRACVAAAAGEQSAAADLFRQAIPLLEAVDMPIYAAAARRRLGDLLDGDEGRTLVAEADGWMAGQSIRNPARMSAVYAPSSSP